MNMPFWRSWLVLWAMMPVFSAFFSMALHRVLSDSVEVQAHHSLGINLVLLTSAALFLAAPFFVLKRHIPEFGAGAHFVVVLSVFAGWFGVTAMNGPVAEFLWDERDFSRAMLNAKIDSPVLLEDIVGLPWGTLVIQKMAAACVVFAGPVLTICVVAKRAGSFLGILLTVALAAATVAVSNAFFDLTSSSYSRPNILNGRAWSVRIAHIASWSVSSVIGASISAIGIGSLLKQSNAKDVEWQSPNTYSVATGLQLAVGTAVGLWVTSFSIQYALGPNGFSSSFAALRKSLSAPPAEEVSTGDSILSFSHVLDAQTYKFPNPFYVSLEISPDHRSAVLLEAHGKNGSQLSAFDLATGGRIANLSPPLKKHERISFSWTKDRQYLIVRSRGEPIETGRYRRHQTKLTLFSLPNYQQVSKWESTDSNCQNPEVSMNSLAEDEQGNLVVLCLNPITEGDERRLAFLLSLPLLDEKAALSYEPHFAGSGPRGLIARGGSVYVPLMKRRGAKEVRLANLTNPDLSVTLEDPYSKDRGGDLTFQGFVDNDESAGGIGMRFCGETGKVDNPPLVSTQTAWGPSFCRTVLFEVSDGSFVRFNDGIETRVNHGKGQIKEFSMPYKAWQFTGEDDPASQKGLFRVSDTENGTVLQTLESSTQTPVVASEEQKSLLTHRINARQIAVYTIRE
ncbi:hypothetical protein [Aliiroseovarius sp. 2305UL8-7]|uniref:hypothetical protein n=1 Tax=Aliiroseovarius conchicola TaxID=3121637 RepID=UPI0035277946